MGPALHFGIRHTLNLFFVLVFFKNLGETDIKKRGIKCPTLALLYSEKMPISLYIALVKHSFKCAVNVTFIKRE